MAQETAAQKKARLDAELKARQDAIIGSLPTMGGSTSTSYPARGTMVFRPGQTVVDAQGKKTDVTGKFYTALYDPTLKTVMDIKANDSWGKSLGDQNAVKALLVQGGFLGKNDYQNAYWSQADTVAMQSLLKEANSAGGKTYQEMLSLIADGTLKAGGGGGTTTTRSVNLSDPATASNIARAGARALLGRDPNELEMKRLTGAITTYEKSNPSITTQTQTAGGNYNVSSTGGATAAGSGEVVEQAIRKDEALNTEATNVTFNSYADGIARLAAGQ